MPYLEKICCFFIFAKVFLHMCPNEKYEKYVSALTGWVAICLFLSPFLAGDMFEQSYELWQTQWQSRIERAWEGENEQITKESEAIAERLSEDIRQMVGEDAGEAEKETE